MQYFTDQDYPQAGAWFWQKPVSIKRPLLDLRALVTVFVADIDLSTRFTDGRLQIRQLPGVAQEALSLARTSFGWPVMWRRSGNEWR